MPPKESNFWGALAAKVLNKDFKVYCMLGDGEFQEGQIWEAAMTVAKYQLNNLICILDKIADTIKGKGVSFMEGKASWHGAVPSAEQYAAVIQELKEVGA